MADKKLIFSDGQAITSTASSTYELDMGVADPNQGAGRPLTLEIDVDTAFTASGAGTLTVALQHSAAGSSYTTIWTTPAIGKATLVKGYQIIKMALPHTFMRFLQLLFTVTTGPMTAGKINAGLV
jgi:hypothetical protein